jgi:hypothetical protein
VPNTQDLINILCVRETRIIDPSGAFSFHRQHFVVIGNIRPGTKIEVIVHRKYGIFALHKGQRYNVCRIDKPAKRQKVATPRGEAKPYIPPDSHYHKRGKDSFVQYSSEYTDTEVLAIINEIFSKSLK